MNINVAIVDQWVRALAEDTQREWLGPVADPAKRRSSAFVFFCLQTALDLVEEEAQDAFVDGGGDAGIDGLHVGDVADDEFVVTIVQAKYTHKNLEGNSNFPANAISRLALSVAALFDPRGSLTTTGKLEALVGEIRSRILDGYVPRVRILCCNNGLRWKKEGDEHIQNAGLGSQVIWEHVGHDLLVELRKKSNPVDDVLQFTGRSLVEDFDHRRVLVGRMSVTDIAGLFDTHGDRLLEKNIRRYLGTTRNRVNRAIRDSLVDPKTRGNFYFYNNGITMVCSQFTHNAMQDSDHKVRVKGLHVINGGQSCKTIQRTLADNPQLDVSLASVLVRLYQIDSEQDELVRDITFATNSQNPVDLRDLRSGDEVQKRLKIAMDQLGYNYKLKRDERVAGPNDITTAIAAEAVYAVWRWKPHIAKFRRSQLFGKYYDDLFSDDLNGAQLIIAVRLFRYAENERRRWKPLTSGQPVTNARRYIPYASYVLAALMGRSLRIGEGLKLAELTHQTYDLIHGNLDSSIKDLYEHALQELEDALQFVGIDTTTATLQRLSAAFRRGDLLQALGPANKGF